MGSGCFSVAHCFVNFRSLGFRIRVDKSVPQVSLGFLTGFSGACLIDTGEFIWHFAPSVWQSFIYLEIVIP